MYADFQDLIQKRFRDRDVKMRMAVVCADEEHTLSAVVQAYGEGLIEPILIGNEENIIRILQSLGCTSELEIIAAADIDDAVKVFVKLIQNDKCQAVMKGYLDSKILLSAIVAKENGLKTGDIISSIAFYKIPNYHKLLGITDPGILPYPDLMQKKGILKNGIDALHLLGYEKPKAAILCPVEKVNPKIIETIHAQELTELGEAGEFGNCTVYGPLSYDLIVNQEAVRIKGVKSDVAGDADLVLVPDINTGNALTKSLSFSAGAQGCTLVLGAKIPVIFTSRASSQETKFRSIAVASRFQNN